MRTQVCTAVGEDVIWKTSHCIISTDLSVTLVMLSTSHSGTAYRYEIRQILAPRSHANAG